MMQQASSASFTPSGGFMNDLIITKSFVVRVLSALMALSKRGCASANRSKH